MKEKPILFSGPMVRAILEGRKTQTRRIVKDQPRIDPKTGDWLWVHHDGREEVFPIERWIDSRQKLCRYGKPGDRLWVKETFFAYGFWDYLEGEYTKTGQKKRIFIDATIEDQYKYIDNPPEKVEKTKEIGIYGWYKRPSLFMPRAASRILLENTDVIVERLLEINEWDAIDEGLEMVPGPDGLNYYGNYGDDNSDTCLDPVNSFRTLWQSINGTESWNKNPFVWAITFRIIQQ